MYSHETQVRVRYAETDQMGVVYYGVYPQYFEVARVEALRNLGLSYREMEDQGVMLPVRDLHIRYKGPARYDELLTIRSQIREFPQARIAFDHEIVGESGRVLTLGRVELVFVDIASRKPCACPASLAAGLAPFFK